MKILGLATTSRRCRSHQNFHVKVHTTSTIPVRDLNREGMRQDYQPFKIWGYMIWFPKHMKELWKWMVMDGLLETWLTWYVQIEWEPDRRLIIFFSRCWKCSVLRLRAPWASWSLTNELISVSLLITLRACRGMTKEQAAFLGMFASNKWYRVLFEFE